ncbi:MAG: HPr family phosphocarrier protein [Pseudomonadota bacterium]
MQTKTVTIINKLGLHARAAAKFVQTASAFESDITVIANNREVSGKSIMGIMMLAAGKGKQIDITVSGADEAEAMHALEDLINNRFGEDE